VRKIKKDPYLLGLKTTNLEKKFFKKEAEHAFSIFGYIVEVAQPA